MENKFYIQCEIKKDGISRLEWIKEQYAVTGNVLDIKEKDNWQSGWTVITCGGKVSDETLLKVIHMSYIEVKQN